jgi:hypothetical protein
MLLGYPVVVDLIVHVISGVKQLFNLKLLLFGVADVTAYDSGFLHDYVLIEWALVDVKFLIVSPQVVKLVYINSIAWVGHYLIQPGPFFWSRGFPQNQIIDLLHILLA